MKKYIKDVLKSFTCGALIGSICCCYVANVTAASSNGEPLREQLGSVSYTMQNSISNGNNSINAYTFNTASKVLEAGCLGIRPTLYSEAGNIVSRSNWVYSAVDSSGVSASVSKTDYTSNYYYSWGDARIWNGSYYDEYYPGRTPNLRFQ